MRKKTAKRAAAMAAALMAASVIVSGCGSKGGDNTGGGSGTTAAPASTAAADGGAKETTAAPEARKDAVELELLISDDTLEGGAMATVVAKFNEEHKDKGIQVKMNEIAYADMQTQIQNRAALIKLSNFRNYIDYVLPLDGSSLTQDDFLLDVSYEGKIYATSINTTAVGLFINKTAFDAAGVAYPLTEDERWTWDEFVSAVNEVVEKNDNVNTGLVIDHSQQRIGTILYQFGMNYFDPADETRFAFRSEETKKVIYFILDMYKDGGIS